MRHVFWVHIRQSQLSLPEVTFKSVTAVPAISMNIFSLGVEVAGPTSSRIRSSDVNAASCATIMPPSATEAAAVSPSVKLLSVKDCPAPKVSVIAVLSMVVPESNSMPVRDEEKLKSKDW